MGKYQELTSSILDAALEHCDIITSIRGDILSEPDCYRHKLLVTLKSKQQEYGETDIEFCNNNHYTVKLNSNGISFLHSSAQIGYIDISDPDYELSGNQRYRLMGLLKRNKTFEYYNDALKWFERAEAFKKIRELLDTKQMVFEECNRISCGFIYDEGDKDANIVEYVAEFGDVLLEFSELDNREIVDDYAACRNESAEYMYIYECIAPRLKLSVGDYFTSTFIGLSSKELACLHFWDNRPKKKTSKQEPQREEVAQRHIDLKDVMVITSMAKCNEKGHIVEKVKASIYVISFDTGKKELHTVRAFYCETCNRYFILERDYENLKRLGAICCSVYSLDELSKINHPGWAQKSMLKIYGYSVSQKDDLSEKERRTILDMVVFNGILSKKRCIEYLEWFVRNASGKNNMDIAIKKWNSDIDYLRNGKRPLANDFVVGTIFTKAGN